MKHFDAVVIGAGPGGYEAALELGRAGLKTLLIDKNKERIGGTCLNEGCIPTKNYLQSAEYASKVSYFSDCGLALEYKGLNLQRLAEKTVALKNEIRSGVVWMLDQAGVEMMYGCASFVDAQCIDVAGEQIRFDKCIIATGSQSREVLELPQNGKTIISSREVFDLEHLPKSIAIIGGGPIGCEFATFFNAFGVEVTLIGRGPQLLSAEDDDVSKALLRAFKKSGIRVLTSSSVQKAVVKDDSVELVVTGETQETFQCDLVLSAIGRDPYTKELNLEKAGVVCTSKGFVAVNAAFQTSQNHIYAIGDCIDTLAFAHTAYAEAKISAYNIINKAQTANVHITPSTIYSHPQIASCGVREKEAHEQGRGIDVKKAFYKANAKAKILGDDSGFAKLIVCADTDVILGATIIGVEATEIIHEIVVAVEMKLTYHEIREMIHAHPSVSEIVRYL